MFRNKLLNIVQEIKKKAIELEGDNLSYEMGKNGDTCFELWLNKLNSSEYNKIFEPIQMLQKGTYVMFRYGRYTDVFSGETEYGYHDFWNLYDGLYRECRSCVIDLSSNPVEYVSLPFDKFFNINENDDTKIEVVNERIKNARIVEFSDKIDGSMVTASYYKGKIEVFGSKSVDPDNSWRLKDAISMLYSNNSYLQMIESLPDMTFIFEYVSLKDAHVVKYAEDEEGLYLIGVRSRRNGTVYPYSKVIELANEYNIKTTQIFDRTIEDIMNSLDEKKSYEKEGFVAYIDEFMVKIKYNDYVALHGILSKISSINLIIGSIANGTYDDILSKVPTAYRYRVEGIANYVFSWIKKNKEYCEKEVNEIKDKFQTDKERFIYVNEKDRYERFQKGWIMSLLKGKEPNYLVLKNGHTLKLKEMGIPEDQYLKFVKEFDNQ